MASLTGEPLVRADSVSFSRYRTFYLCLRSTLNVGVDARD